MEILKRIGCRVITPLLLTIAGLLMIVVVPMNASQFFVEEEVEVQKSDVEPDSLYDPSNGLIYFNLKQDKNSTSSETGVLEVRLPDKKIPGS